MEYYNFNFNEKTTIPPFYKSDEKETRFPELGFKLKFSYDNKVNTRLYLEIGKKYYIFLNKNQLVAFKVLGVAISYHNDDTELYYKVILADGKIEWWEAKRKFGYEGSCSNVFETKENFNQYILTGDRTKYMYLNHKPLLTYFLPLADINIFEVVKNVFCCPCYESYGFRAIKVATSFKTLWIDENGLHFQVPLQHFDHKYYTSVKECEASFSVTDFDDEEDNNAQLNSNVTICIKDANKNEVIEALNKLGYIVNWVLYK